MKSFVLRVSSVLLRDRLLLALVCIALALSVWLRPASALYHEAIDWATIMTLSGLLILARGLEASGMLDLLARTLIAHLHQQRSLAMFLVLAAALLSTLLTNDIALFVIVPLTLGLRHLAVLPVSRLIIFEALAVNAGSLLSPIGNPQNILLWQQSGLTFWGFVLQMLPLGLLCMAGLLMLTAWRFPAKKIDLHPAPPDQSTNRRLAYRCSILFICFVIAVEYKQAAWGLLGVLLFIGWQERKLILHADWPLILVFMLMFVDIRLLTQWPLVHDWLALLGRGGESAQLWTAALVSQFISNVPATILMLQYTPPSIEIAYGVNIGGFGLALGSMANLIALRMSGDKKIGWAFHAYSFPSLAFSMGAAMLLL